MEKGYTYEVAEKRTLREKIASAVSPSRNTFSLQRDGKVIYRLSGWEYPPIRNLVAILNAERGK